jgi:alpha-galactosidase
MLISALMVPLTRATSPAPPPNVRYFDSLQIWILDTARTSYAIGVNQENDLQSLYWGGKLQGDAGLLAAHTVPQSAPFDSSETMTKVEYPGWGGRYYNEPALKVTLADGVRDLILKYESYEIHHDTLLLRLKDIQFPLFVNLTYTVTRWPASIRRPTFQMHSVPGLRLPWGEKSRRYLRWVRIW